MIYVNVPVAPAQFREVSSVGVVTTGDKLLMGKRKDSGKWTLPGGHLELGETPHEGAIRELKEEAGIDAHQLTHLGSEIVISESGIPLKIHAYKFFADPKTTTKYDPDDEVSRWQWVDVSNGVPFEIQLNLHSPRNVVLKQMGLQRWGMEFVTNKSEEFVIDLSKSKPHKYIRKYKHKGRWVYIYHEKGKSGRVMEESAVNKLKHLGELGHEQSRKLFESMEEHDQNKIKKLAELHHLGYKSASDHLKKLGLLNLIKEKQFTRDILQRREERDPYKKPLTSTEKNRATSRIERALKSKVFDYLEGYRTSDPYKKLAEANITLDSVMNKIKEKDSVSGIIKELDQQMSRIDRAHEGVTSQNSSANQAGGYGNLGFNAAIGELVNTNILPEQARGLLTRTQENRGNIEFDSETVNRLQREAEERRRREEREVEGSMAQWMGSLTSTRLSTQKMKELNNTLKSIFNGQQLRKEDWPYDFSDYGIDVRIESLSFSGDRISMSLAAYKGSTRITDSWERSWSKKNNQPHIYNAYLTISERNRGYRVGELINRGQLEMMKKYAPNGSIGVTANISVGGYTWCNTGFKFGSTRELDNYRRQFQSFARSKGLDLSDQDMQKFTLPCHFAAFNDGRYYERRMQSAKPLSQRQQQTGYLSGIEGKGPKLTDDEIRNKKTPRVACHLGKAFMLGKSWHGVMKMNQMNERNEAYKFFMAYNTMKEKAWTLTNEEYKGVVEAARERAPASRSSSSSSRSSSSRSSSSRSSGTGTGLSTSIPRDRPRIRRLPTGYRNWPSSRLREYWDRNTGRLSSSQQRSLRNAIQRQLAEGR